MTQRSEDNTSDSPLIALLPYLGTAWLIVFFLLFFTSDLPNASVGDQTVSRLTIIQLLPELIWSNFVPNSGPMVPSGWKYVLQRGPILAYAGFMLIGILSVGRLIMRLLSRTWLPWAEFNALGAGLGMSAVSLMTLALGLFGQLQQTLFFIAITIFIVAEAFCLLRKRSPQDQSESEHPPANPWLRSICVVAIVLFVGPMLLGAMLPSTDFDVKEYHLQGPKEYYLLGQITMLPHNVYTSFPFLTEMLSLCGMVLTDNWFLGALVGKTVLMAFAPMTALALFAMTRRLTESADTAWLAATIYLSTPWVYRISIIAYTEGALCCYVALSLLALLVWLERSQQSSTPQYEIVLLAGLLGGSAIATKYPGLLLVAVPIGLMIWITLLLRKAPWKQIAFSAGLYTLGVVITFGPWLGKNYAETGNPVYPLAYSVFGGKDWTPELDAKWKRGHSRPSPVLKAPGKMFQDLRTNINDVIIRSDWQSPLMFGFAPLAFFGWRRRGLWYVFAFGLAILGVWYTMTHLIDRFWVPVLPVIAVLAGIGMRHLQDTNRFNRWLAYALFGVTLLYNWAFITSPASGNNGYLLEMKYARDVARTPSISLANRYIGAEDRLLFVGEAQVFDAEFEHLYNTVFDESILQQLTAKEVAENEWEFLPAEEIIANLDSGHFTHLLVNWNEILRYRLTYGYTDFVTPERFGQLAERWDFREIQMNGGPNMRPWDSLSESEQREVERFGPSLKTIVRGQSAFRQYQIFERKQNGRGE